MFIKPANMSDIQLPVFRINNEVIKVETDYTYLGHIICNTLADNLDIMKQRRKLYAQGNSIIRKFSMCTLQVKLTLFQSYCTPMYLAQLWTHYKQGTINKLYIAYHTVLKMFLGLSKWEHTRPICAMLNVQYCPALIRGYIYKFMCRLKISRNVLIQSILGTSCFFNSRLWKHWRKLLYTNGIG